MVKYLSSKLVFECAKEEDILSNEIIEEVSFYLGLANIPYWQSS